MYRWDVYLKFMDGSLWSWYSVEQAETGDLAIDQSVARAREFSANGEPKAGRAYRRDSAVYASNEDSGRLFTTYRHLGDE